MDNRTIFSSWVQKELIPYVKKIRDQLKITEAKALFIVDCFTGHFGSAEDLCAANNINMVFIPPGTTSLVQPLDLTLNKK